jgi:hypothetical protein
MSFEVFGDGGDAEDLMDVAAHYHYHLDDDNKWRETPDDPGFTDEDMWQYINDRRDSEAEDLAGE